MKKDEAKKDHSTIRDFPRKGFGDPPPRKSTKQFYYFIMKFVSVGVLSIFEGGGGEGGGPQILF